MIDHLNTLFINIPDSDLSAILEIFRNDDIPVNHQTVSAKEITEVVERSNHLDLIILYERGNSFTLLNQLSDHYNSIPIIYFARNYTGQKAAAVMAEGAKDCISHNQIERLLPIIGRELENKQVRDNFERAKKIKKVLSDISDLSTEKVFIFDTKTHKCIFTNKTAVQKCGYTKDEILSLKASDIYCEYSQDIFTELISPLLHGTQEKISICTNIKRKMGGIYPAEIHLKKIKSGENTYILATSKDISGAWYKVQKLKRQRSLTDKYIQKSKQKDTLIANAAHDMRTSLNSIILSNKLLDLKNNKIPKEKIAKLTQNIRFSGNHLIEYINEFFDSSETDKQIKYRNISLHTFGKQLYQSFKPVALEQNITFNYHADNLQHNSIRSNRTYIKRILKNILSNAFKYTREGSVTLKLFSTKNEEIDIEFETDNVVAFQVQDTGVGIPKSKQKQIFNRHSRVKETQASKSDGSGLGLDIAQKLTQALGGKLHIDSTIDLGSTFTLYLPNNEPDTTNSVTENQHQSAESPETSFTDPLDRSILVVDDSSVHNLAIKEFLSFAFRNCITAQTLEDALNILDQQSIDCIVLDYVILDTNSLQVAKTLRKIPKYANTPIIIYTGKKLNIADRHTLSKYANAIVKKNTNSYNKLVSTIYSCLRDDRPINHSMV